MYKRYIRRFLSVALFSCLLFGWQLNAQINESDTTAIHLAANLIGIYQKGNVDFVLLKIHLEDTGNFFNYDRQIPTR